jgi:hypothetical protein
VQLGSPQFKKKIFTQRCFTGISQFLAKKTGQEEKICFCCTIHNSTGAKWQNFKIFRKGSIDGKSLETGIYLALGETIMQGLCE